MLVAVVKKCHAQHISVILIIFVFKEMFANYFDFSAKSSGMIEIFMYFAVGICCGSSSIKFLSSVISDKAFIYTNSTGCCCLNLNHVQAEVVLLASLFACD